MFNRIKAVFIIATVFSMTGCNTFSTNPNPPFSGELPGSIIQLSSQNESLVLELCKLPEIQDGISESDRRVLDKIEKNYRQNPNGFDRIFRQMNTIGKPDKRKYCSPLQAYFWTVEEGDKTFLSNLHRSYGMYKLLEHAWVGSHAEHIVEWKWRKRESEKLSASCLDDEIISCVNRAKVSGADSVHYLIGKAKQSPEKFGYQFDEATFGEFQEKTMKRWRDFKQVTDRLNAPELIQFWLNSNIKYTSDGSAEYWREPEQMFNDRAGDCEDFSILAVYCCLKGGYPSNVVINMFEDPENPLKKQGHAVGVYKDKGQYYIIGNTNGKMSGPYKSYHAAGRTLSEKGEVYNITFTQAIELGRFVSKDTKIY